MRPADLPTAEHYAHGTRARYVTGCRCAPCRESNRLYYHQRKGQPFNGLVDAGPARAHLATLSSQGIGRRAVSEACDVADSVVVAIGNGSKSRVRAETARRILSVDSGARSDSALVPARPTWRLVRELLKLGLTRGAIAQRLGAKRLALQLGRTRVLARTALAVEKLHREVTAPPASPPECLRCEYERRCAGCLFNPRENAEAAA